jgi:hypothetical protein
MILFFSNRPSGIAPADANPALLRSISAISMRRSRSVSQTGASLPLCAGK